jgi:hypothetical protein
VTRFRTAGCGRARLAAANRQALEPRRDDPSTIAPGRAGSSWPKRDRGRPPETPAATDPMNRPQPGRSSDAGRYCRPRERSRTRRLRVPQAGARPFSFLQRSIGTAASGPELAPAPLASAAWAGAGGVAATGTGPGLEAGAVPEAGAGTGPRWPWRVPRQPLRRRPTHPPPSPGADSKAAPARSVAATAESCGKTSPSAGRQPCTRRAGRSETSWLLAQDREARGFPGCGG